MEATGVAGLGPRVVSIYEGFFSGGARALHTAVVRGLDATTNQRHAVLSLTNRSLRESSVQLVADDANFARLTTSGVPVTTLDRISTQPFRHAHLAALERATAEADLVLSLKEQPLAALNRVAAGGRPVIVCLHRSDPEHQGRALDDLVEGVDRGIVRAAVCCARSTQAAYHAATGIPLERLPVIPNGVDLHRFRRSVATRSRLRWQLGVVGDAPMVLLSARFDPMKDISLFLRAGEIFAREHPDAHLVLCGAGMSLANAALVELLSDLLRGWDRAHRQVHLLGIRHDMPGLYSAADLVALTSAYGEASPLSLLEAMACGAVPVTTDVGDAADMVGDPRLVTDREPDGVARAWSMAFDQRAEHTGRVRRQRQRLSDQRTLDAYAHLIGTHAASETLELVV